MLNMAVDVRVCSSRDTPIFFLREFPLLSAGRCNMCSRGDRGANTYFIHTSMCVSIIERCVLFSGLYYENRP